MHGLGGTWSQIAVPGCTFFAVQDARAEQRTGSRAALMSHKTSSTIQIMQIRCLKKPAGDCNINESLRVC